LRAAAAGATAATVWALEEPLDQRLLRCDYSDVALLGKAVTRGPGWRAAGLASHALHGALFGLPFHTARRILTVDSRKLALGMALAEHVGLFPLCYFVDRYHPARGEPGIPPLLTNPRAFAQATWRHALFGAVLGWLAQDGEGVGSRRGQQSTARKGAPMSAEENKAIARRVNDEVWSGGRLEVIDELIADDFVTTVVGAPEQIRGRQGFREFVVMYRTAFPDLRISVDEQVAEGETVVTRWTGTGTHEGELMGIAATGKQVTTAGINVDRVAGGQLHGGWGLFDQLGLLQQIGAVPMPTRV